MERPTHSVDLKARHLNRWRAFCVLGSPSVIIRILTPVLVIYFLVMTYGDEWFPGVMLVVVAVCTVVLVGGVWMLVSLS